MLTRRAVIQGGAAVAMMAYGGSLAADDRHETDVDSSAVHPYQVIFDNRHNACVSFARHAQHEGLNSRATRGDITKLWYADLYHRWQQSPAAIAGLTDAAVLFCLATFARDVNMRVAYRAEHRTQGPGRLEHRIYGAGSMPRRAAALLSASEWTQGAARLFAGCRVESAGGSETLQLVTMVDPELEAVSLVSWLIAPKAT